MEGCGKPVQLSCSSLPTARRPTPRAVSRDPALPSRSTATQHRGRSHGQEGLPRCHMWSTLLASLHRQACPTAVSPLLTYVLDFPKSWVIFLIRSKLHSATCCPAALLQQVCSKAEAPTHWQEVSGWARGHPLPLQDARNEIFPMQGDMIFPR